MIEMTCGKCGKIFIPAPQHIYKDDEHIYCSWTCYNHRDDGKKKVKGKHSRSVIMRDLNGNKVKEFASAQNASEFTGYHINRIRDACRDSTVFRGCLWEYGE